MSKEKQGEYISLWWPLDPSYELVRGHVTEEEARATVAYQDGKAEGGEYVQCWARRLQTAHSRAEGLACEFRLYDTPGRGKFPVTALVFSRSAIERAELPR